MPQPTAPTGSDDTAPAGWDGLWQAMLAARPPPGAFAGTAMATATAMATGTAALDAVRRAGPAGTAGANGAGAAADADCAALFALYEPLLDARARASMASPPWVIAQLGQSLDGCVATASGDSTFVTGPASLVHLHRLRALADAVLVGAGTVAADDPQLTTRRVPGPHPVRVVLDPTARLDGRARVLRDRQAPTLWLCDTRHADRARARLHGLVDRDGPAARGRPGGHAGGDAARDAARDAGGDAARDAVDDAAGDTLGPAGGGRAVDGGPGHAAEVLAVDGLAGGGAGAAMDPARAVAALAARGLQLLFVEGGGVTVSRFLAAGLLDRLHLVVSPLLIGDGRRGLQGPARARLADCPRPPARRLALGEDMLWDLDLRAAGPRAGERPGG